MLLNKVYESVFGDLDDFIFDNEEWHESER